MQPVQEIERKKRSYRLSIEDLQAGKLSLVLRDIPVEERIENLFWENGTITVKTFKKTQNEKRMG